jgi:RimJ/RimL family protein N-acetyltransferase
MSVEIETDRLTLTPLTQADVPAVARILGDARVARMLRVIPHPFPPEDAAAYVARLGSGAGVERAWGVRLRDDPALIGVISAKFPATSETPRIGYYLDPAFWGRGIMSETVAALVARLIDEGAPAVEAGVFDDNPASRALLERLGFAFAPAADAWCVGRGAHVPYAYGRVTAGGFRAARAHARTSA